MFPGSGPVDIVFAAEVGAAEEPEGAVADGGGVGEGRRTREVDAEGYGARVVEAKGCGYCAAEAVADNAKGVCIEARGELEGGELAAEEVGGVDLREGEENVCCTRAEGFVDGSIPGCEGGEIGERNGAAVVDVGCVAPDS